MGLKAGRGGRTFLGRSTRGITATGLAAGLVATGLTVDLTAVFGAVLGAATFEAAAFEPVAFAAIFAVFFGIELLLFFEDFAAAALLAVRVSLREARARLLVAPRLAAAAFLEALEALFLRVFFDTASGRKCHAPVRCFYGNLLRHRIRMGGVGLECYENSPLA